MADSFIYRVGHGVAGCGGTRWVESCPPLYIPKYSPATAWSKRNPCSAWSAEAAQFCQSRGVTAVAVAGWDADQCALTTVVDIFEANLRPFMLADCWVSSRGPEFYHAALILL